jgi:hypothetical protein
MHRGGIDMTHRTALALSIALTLVLATGVFIGRDRLFAAETGAGPSTVPVSMSNVTGSIDGASATELAPRIVEVPLPASLASDPASEQGYTFEDADERHSDDDWNDDDHRDDHDRYDDDHEEEDDDD